MARLRERLAASSGAATVEMVFVLPVILVLGMGFFTVVDVLYQHHRLAAVVEDATRFAGRADYDDPAAEYPEGTETCANPRRRSATQVQAFAAEAGDVDAGDVTVSTNPCTAYPGDEVTVAIEDKVDNPLYAAAAALTNTVVGLVGGDDIFPASGLPIRAEASTYVE